MKLPGGAGCYFVKVRGENKQIPLNKIFYHSNKKCLIFWFFFSCIHNVATKIFCPLELCVTLCLRRNQERNGRGITSVNQLVLVCYKEKYFIPVVNYYQTQWWHLILHLAMWQVNVNVFP